ncbi:hypothetical protein [Streptomyces sp. NPDC002044]|uniref:hypothetical protein n=1 Tax=Streptomyces sp. NPDC002044 TaxID=3154662 RepID=UPI00332A24C3
MIGRRSARTAPAGALTRVLTVVCVVLLCVFGAGPAAATAAESRPAHSAPAEGSSDPAADPEVRVAVRTVTRGAPVVRRLPAAVFHVKHPLPRPGCGPVWARDEPVPSRRAVRSVVLRC